MTVYYNEWNPYAADWLRNLIKEGHLPDGEVDTRSIADVTAIDLIGYDQVHFFAGIGGWSLALRLAGWPDDRPVWTGSCPCQPFSAAGKRKGAADARHLWPEFARLIHQCRPAIVFGEQVASKDGRLWLAGIRADLEAMGYAVGAADLCAAGVGAPHIRQRLWWVADAGVRGREPRAGDRGIRAADDGAGATAVELGAQGAFSRLEHAARDGREQRRAEPSGRGLVSGCGEGGGVGNTERQRVPDEGYGAAESAPCGMQGADGKWQRLRTDIIESSGASNFWSAADWLPCTDGKARRVEPGTFPLAHGVSNRVGRLRAYGNAIVPQVAAEFVRTCLDIEA